MTRSMAASKCFKSTTFERCRAAMRAASLHTFAMSAPVSVKNIKYLLCIIHSNPYHGTGSVQFIYFNGRNFHTLVSRTVAKFARKKFRLAKISIINNFPQLSAPPQKNKPSKILKTI